MVFSTAYPRIHFTIYLEVYLGRGGIFDCVSAYPRIHFTIYYLEVYLGRGGIFDCVSAYLRIHFTIYQEVYLGRGGTFDCVSAYPAFSEVQLQNGRVFCSYSRQSPPIRSTTSRFLLLFFLNLFLLSLRVRHVPNGNRSQAVKTCNHLPREERGKTEAADRHTPSPVRTLHFRLM